MMEDYTRRIIDNYPGLCICGDSNRFMSLTSLFHNRGDNTKAQ